MIKKNFLLLIFALQFVCVFAVWEGNGGVGSMEEFPNGGLFVKSDMFPKHTLLEITNLEKNITARAAVTGSSGIQGLLISVSPELALKLSIPSGKVVRVRILTPSPVHEPGDDGIGLPSGSVESKDLDSNPALFSADVSSGENDGNDTGVTASEEPITESASIPIDKTEPPQAVKENIEAEPAELPNDTAEENIVTDAEKVEEKPQNIQNDNQVKELPEENDELIFYDNTVAETEAWNMLKPDFNSETAKPAENNLEPATDSVIQSIPNMNPIQNPETVPAPEPAPVVPQINPIVYMEPADMRPPVSVGSIIKPDSKNEPETPVNEVNKPLDPPSISEPPQEKVNDIAVVIPPADEKKSEMDFAVSGVSPIQKPQIDNEDNNKAPIDIPQIKVPEQNEEIYEIKEPENISAITIDSLPQRQEEKSVSIDEVPAPKKEEVIENKDSINKTKLEKGKLYIQIAGYKDFGTADSVVKKYGNIYPVFIEEKNSKDLTRFIVFIGPLQKEEIGAVIERFKKLGFSGAFLKRDMIKGDF